MRAHRCCMARTGRARLAHLLGGHLLPQEAARLPRVVPLPDCRHAVPTVLDLQACVQTGCLCRSSAMLISWWQWLSASHAGHVVIRCLEAQPGWMAGDPAQHGISASVCSRLRCSHLASPHLLSTKPSRSMHADARDQRAGYLAVPLVLQVVPHALADGWRAVAAYTHQASDTDLQQAWVASSLDLVSAAARSHHARITQKVHLAMFSSALTAQGTVPDACRDEQLCCRLWLLR